MTLGGSMKAPAKSDLAILARVVAIVVLAGMLWVMWSGVRSGIWVDSDVYAMGGHIARTGGDLYAALTERALPFTYSPFAAVAFVPLSLLEPATGRLAFTAVTLACYLLVIAVVCLRLRLPAWKAVMIGGIGLALEPMERNLMLGQINVVLMAMVVCDWLLLPPRYRGYLTGLAIGIKITPAAFVVLALVQRHWAIVGRTAVGFFATTFVGLWVLPQASLSYWGGGFMGLARFGPGVTYSDNQSLLASWLRLTGAATPSAGIQMISLLVGMSLGIGAAVVELRRTGADREVAALAWVALGSLLASPISWSHHWVWFLLALALLLSRGRYLQFGLMSLAMWYPTIWLTYAKTHDGLPLSPQERVLSCLYTIFALLLLLTAVLGRRPARDKACTSRSPANPHSVGNPCSVEAAPKVQALPGSR